jgi:outer membrane protein assembly factor BamB
VPFISVSGGSGTTTGHLDETSWTAVVTSTALTLQRGGSPGANATIAWQVVEFVAQASPMNVIGGDQSGRVYAVDTGLGTQDWQVTLTGADAVQAAVSAQVWDWSDVNFQGTYSDHVIFAVTRNSSTTNNKVFALRAKDGTVLWTFNGAGAYSVDYIVGMAAVDYVRNRLYVASRAGASGTQSSLWVINTLDGALVQSFNLGHLETSPTPSYDGTTLYVGNTAGDLYAINLATLTVKWASPAALGTRINGFVWEAFTTFGRLYFTTADGNVRCVQDNGTSASACSGWTLSNVAGASTPLLLDKLFVGSSDGKVHQINLTTGTDEKQFPAATTLDGTTVGDVSTETGNEIFVGTSGGKIFRIDLVSGALP